MSCQSCCQDTPKGRTDLQYAVKIACGVVKEAKGNPLPLGQYFTAVNIHNPSRCDVVTFRWKVAVGLPGLKVGDVSPFAEAKLGPDEALEIDCPDVMERLRNAQTKPAEFVKGWVIIETENPLDVVAVYGTSASVGGALNALHTERVEPRCLPVCEDFGFDISTGVAAWEVALPGSSDFAPAVLTAPNNAWGAIGGALWIRPSNEKPKGDYTYRLLFDLCSGFSASDTSLQLLSDDKSTVFLNGPPLVGGNQNSPSHTNANVATVTIPANRFKAGRNELRVVVNNGGGVATGMALHGFFEFDKGRCPGSPLPLLPCPGVCYQVHVKGDGWLGWVCNGATAGTTGGHRRIEAIKISLTGATPNTTIEYQAHLEDTGWTDWTAEGQQCGTTGQNRRMEAVKIRLVNAPLNCHVKYRVHMKNKGWSDWAYDGVQAGTTGQNRRIEAIEIVIA